MLRSAAHRRFGAALVAAVIALSIWCDASAQQLFAPAFSSTPVTAAVQGTAYSYSITVTDADQLDVIAIRAAAPLPPWLTLTDHGNRTATLAGIPGPPDVGDHAVTLSASDGVNAVQQAFTITVDGANDAPVAANDAYATAEDTQLTIAQANGVLVNDTDADGDALTAALVADVAHGTLALNANGSFIYMPNANFNGPDTFTYRANDGTAPGNTATVTINVSTGNDLPAAINDSYSTAENTPLTVAAATGVLANDTDLDADPLTAVLVANVASGTLFLNADGSFMFTPAAGFSGNATFTYQANDGTGASNIATVTIAVSSVNAAPVAAADSYTTNQGTALTVPAASGVLANDTDADGNALTAVLVTSVASGALTLSADGSFTFTPAAGFGGQVSFTYQASDGTASSAAATVTITVGAVNGAPTAAADAYTTAEDTMLTIAPAAGVLANDTDPDAGTTLTAVLGSAVTNGTLALAANGSFTYTPAPNFSGTATFTYSARDGGLASAAATVTITVTPVNDAPFFTNAPSTAATEGVTYTYTMAASDPDGGVLVFAAPTLPAWLAFTPPATISGTPTQVNAGAHDVVVTVSDGVGAPVARPFQITVQPVDDQPVIVAIPDQTATEGVPFALDLAQFVTDADTPPQSIVYAAVGGLPAGLTLTPAGVLSGVPLLPVGNVPLTVAFTATDGTPPAVRGQFALTVLRAGRADLAVAVSAAPNPVAVGAAATWTLTVTNQSPLVDVPSFTLDVVLGGDVPFRLDAPSTPACTASTTGSETRLSCTLGPLAGGASTSVTISGSGNLAGDVFASATVAVNGVVPVDETTANNRATGSLSVAQQIVAAPGQSIPGLSARAAAAADLDGDGFDDLAVATGSAQGLIVLANVADPANASKRLLSTVPQVLGGEAVGNDVAIADLDGDGHLDIVVAAGAGASNRVFLAAAGGYVSTPLANAAAGSRAVAVGDVNGDGFLDIVFAGPNGSKVFLNTGSGGVFTAGASVGNRAAQDVALVDLFGDALPELVVANADGDAQVFRNTGGAFALELALATGPATSVGAADFNGDGSVDLVFGRSAGAAPGARPSNLVWLNTSGARGELFLSDELGAAATAGVTVDDVDGDGDADVLAVNGDGVEVFANSGSGTFALRAQQLDTMGATSAVTGKLNADDRDDVAVVAGGGIDVFYNDGSGNFGSGDTTGPTITLVGEAAVTVKVGAAYTDAGATATDTVDGDVTSRIKVTNPVDTAVIGTYTVTYNATDLSGNAALPATRTVRVQAEQTAQGGGGGAIGLELALLLLAKLGTGYFSRSRRAEK